MSISILKENTQKIKEMNKVMENNIYTNFMSAINKNYINNTIIYLYDDYDSFLNQISEINKTTDLKNIYKQDIDEYTKEILNIYKEETEKNTILIEKIAECTKTIDKYIENYYNPIKDYLNVLCNIYEFDFELEEHLLRVISNYFITKRIKIDTNDIDSFMSIISTIEDYKLSQYIDNVLNKLDEIELDDIDSGIEIVENGYKNNYESMPTLDDFLKDIKDDF